MDVDISEKALKLEEIIDRKMKLVLVAAMAERDKVFEQQKIFSDLRRNIVSLEKYNISNLQTMVNLGSEVYVQADVMSMVAQHEHRRRVVIVAIVLVAVDTFLKNTEWYRRSNKALRAPYTYNRNPEHRLQNTLARFYIDSDTACLDNLCMRRLAFHRLCDRLKGLGLSDSRYLKVEEQVAMFLLTVGHDNRLRRTRHEFRRSNQTVSHYFHVVLQKMLVLFRQVVQNAIVDNSPLVDGPWDVYYHRYFKDAVGALDGTHFETMVPVENQARYRSRKGVVSQNCLVACTFDMRFTYVLAGWEGSAHDGRVLRRALVRPGRQLTIPSGKYYLVDVGYALSPGFLTPYRGVRYHLKEKGHHAATNEDELYNFRHSSLRNVVERVIGVLKMRFAYLRKAPYHDVHTHTKIILACCGLHYFLKDIDPDDVWHPDEVNLVDEEELVVPEEIANVGNEIVVGASPEWTEWRDNLKHEMWHNFSNNLEVETNEEDDMPDEEAHD